MQHPQATPPAPDALGVRMREQDAKNKALEAQRVAAMRPEERAQEEVARRCRGLHALATLNEHGAKEAHREGDLESAQDLKRWAAQSRHTLARLQLDQRRIPTAGCARRARPRGAGRPRAHATRRSSTARDDGSDGEPGPAPEVARAAVAAVWLDLLRERHPAVAWDVMGVAS